MIFHFTRSQAGSRKSACRLATLALTAVFLGFGPAAQGLSMPQRTTPHERAVTSSPASSQTRSVLTPRGNKARPAKAVPGSQPYLALINLPPLRFAEELPMATEAPAALILPQRVEPKPEPVAVPLPPPPPPPPAPVIETKPPPPPTASNEPKPLSILPDDTKREVRPEDVLPFFQLPQSSAGVSVGVGIPFTPAQPSGTSLPPSSATYQQR